MPLSATTKELLSSLQKHQDKKALKTLRESAFVNDDERKAYKALRRHVSIHGKFPSKDTFERRLKIPYVITREPVSYYMSNFNDMGKYQSIQRSYSDLTEAMSIKDVNRAEAIITTIASNLKTYNTEAVAALRSFDELAEAVFEDYKIAQWSGGMRGITCGWPEIDAVTGGYANGDVVVWAARLGRGKTWLLLYQALKAAMAGHKTVFISPEVPGIQLVRRMIGAITGINPRLIARGQLSTEVYRGMVETIEGIRRQLPIKFLAGSFQRTMNFANAVIEDEEPDYAVLDAAYLMNPEKQRRGSGGRRETIADVSNEIKTSAASFDIPFNISVQLNRTAVKSESKDPANSTETRRTRKDPLAHLDVHKIAETDALAQDASLVFMSELGDPPFANLFRYIGLKKGREGEDGLWKINYKFTPFDFSVVHDGNQTQTQVNDEDLDEDID